MMAPAELAALEDRLKALLKDARETEAKAETIENAAYDLKAVNPHRTDTEDQRTPAEILTMIRQHGGAVQDALARLERLLDQETQTCRA